MSRLIRVLCLSVLLFAAGVCVVANEPSDAEPSIPETNVDEESELEQIPITASPEAITNTNDDDVDDSIVNSVEKLSLDDEGAADAEAVARDNGYGNKAHKNPVGQGKKEQNGGKKEEVLAEKRLKYLADHGHIALPKGGLTGKAAHDAASKLHSVVKTTVLNAVDHPSPANHKAVNAALEKHGVAKLHAHLEKDHKTPQPMKAAAPPTKGDHAAGKSKLKKQKSSKAQLHAGHSEVHHSPHPKGAQAG